MLCYFGETWLKSKMPLLLPSDNEALRRATWLSFLGFGQGPIADLMPDLEPCYAEEIERTAQANEQADRDFHQDSLADHLLILYLWNTLPDNLLEQFWRESPVRMRQHAVWFLGTQLALPDLPDDARKRGLAYWERRVEAAKAASDPDLFRLEVGAIGHLCIHGQVADVWLLDQLSSLLAAGFVPTDAFSVVDWLHKISKQHVDKSVAVLSALLTNPRVDKWAYMTQREPIRAILSNGFSEGSPETAARAQELIGFLSTIGETGYLDLVPSSAD
jgi:hypothetical protein